jgi:hypothetical protein
VASTRGLKQIYRCTDESRRRFDNTARIPSRSTIHDPRARHCQAHAPYIFGSEILIPYSIKSCSLPLYCSRSQSCSAFTLIYMSSQPHKNTSTLLKHSTLTAFGSNSFTSHRLINARARRSPYRLPVSKSYSNSKWTTSTCVTFYFPSSFHQPHFYHLTRRPPRIHVQNVGAGIRSSAGEHKSESENDTELSAVC